MDQSFEPLSAEDIADLEAKRSWVREHYDEAARHQYDTVEGKLRLVTLLPRNSA